MYVDVARYHTSVGAGRSAASRDDVVFKPSQAMESSNWEIPVARLPTIVTTQISGHLPFPVPLEPSAGSNGNLNSTDSLPTAEVLNAAAAALAEADISHVYVCACLRDCR